MEQSPMNQMSFDGALMIGSELLEPVLRVPSGQTLGGRCPGQHRQTPGNNMVRIQIQVEQPAWGRCEAPCKPQQSGDGERRSPDGYHRWLSLLSSTIIMVLFSDYHGYHQWIMMSPDTLFFHGRAKLVQELPEDHHHKDNHCNNQDMISIMIIIAIIIVQ